jgi:hypothetical protein
MINGKGNEFIDLAEYWAKMLLKVLVTLEGQIALVLGVGVKVTLHGVARGARTPPPPLSLSLSLSLSHSPGPHCRVLF